MKRIFWWTLFGVSAAGLPTLWLAQSVLGQPDVRVPVVLPQPTPPAATPAGKLTPRSLDLTTGHFPELPPEPLFPVPKPMAPMPMAPMPIVPPLPPSDPFLPVSPAAPMVPKVAAPVLLVPAAKPDAAGAGSLEAQPGRQSPSLSIEWNAPAQVRILQPMPCQILVKNTSNSAVHNVIVRHRVGQGVVCKSSEPKVAQDDGELVWALGTLAPDQTRRIDLVLVTQARGTLNCQATATFTAVAGHHVQVREPMLAVKVQGADKVIAGETINLAITVSNPGDGVAEAVKLKALLPDGLEHASGRKTIEFDVGNLGPKETKSMQLPCLAKGSGMQKCAIVASGDGNITANDGVQLEILVPKLDVAIAGPKLRYLDRRAIYVLKVTNPGSAAATGVEVQELIPSGFKFQQANHGGQFQETTRLVMWQLGDLQPGQSKEIAVDLVPIETGDFRLLAHIKTAGGLKTEAEIRTIVEGLPSLSIEVAHGDDPIEVGAETAYEIRVANAGTKTESNVEVICTLPEQIEFKGASCTSPLRFRQEGRDLIFEPLAKLAPKAEAIYRVQVRGIAPGDIRFRTRIRADGLKEPLLREESTRIYSDDAPLRSSPVSAPVAPPSVGVPGKVSNEPTNPFPAPMPASTTVPTPSSVNPAIPIPTPMVPAPIPVFPPVSGGPSTAPILPPTPLPIPVPINP